MKPERAKKAEEIYRTLVETPEENQAAFLRQACGDDEELRQEVESMVETRRAAVFVPVKSGAKPLGLAPEPNPGKSLLVGTQLGLYEVEELIGAGGMGEVYRARDQRLRRAVALKVLPASSGFDPESLARLEREARMLAALNHPNIATIHGLEESEGTRFLVLELVEGETLAERLQRGRLPMEETLGLCRQIAEGLEAAHEKGIIHRDLKPANIKITPEGKVKILDFGLAKAHQSAPDPEASTITQDMTRPGTVMGTPAYMSPEQALGRPLDKRGDIWAFGCVLFECLSGRKAFQGESTTETLAAVLKGEPDWQALPAGTPEKLRHLVGRCLRKDPKERLHDIADARIELAEQGRLFGEPPKRVPRFSGRGLVGACVAIVALGLLAGAGWWFGSHRAPRPAPGAGPPRLTSLAVKPFDDYSPGTNQAYLSDGMTESLCAALGNISALSVRSRSSVMRYKGSAKTVQEMARELKVEGVVEGSVQRAGDRLLVTVQLIEAATDRPLWSNELQAGFERLFQGAGGSGAGHCRGGAAAADGGGSGSARAGAADQAGGGGRLPARHATVVAVVPGRQQQRVALLPEGHRD